MKTIKVSSAAADAVVHFATSKRQMKRRPMLVYYDLAMAAVLPLERAGGPLSHTVADSILHILEAASRVVPSGGALIDLRGVIDLLDEINRAQSEIRSLAVDMGLLREGAE